MDGTSTPYIRFCRHAMRADFATPQPREARARVPLHTPRTPKTASSTMQASRTFDTSTDEAKRVSIVVMRPHSTAGNRTNYETSEAQYEAERQRLCHSADKRRAETQQRMQLIQSRRECNLHSPQLRQMTERSLRSEELRLRSAHEAKAQARAEQERRGDAAMLSYIQAGLRDDAARYARHREQQASVNHENLRMIEQKRELARQHKQNEVEFERKLSASHFDQRWGTSDR
ncbi:hypothetical protein AB1Y20_001710 [Prymnesium parvum]|uniref:Uncharacterized protein n=1 Tax=Prymnesium parvum TaxID=97485 RepID=A0AB34KE15_PRYPA